MAKTYTKDERAELDNQLASMSDDELKALETAGGRLLKQGKTYDWAEYNRRYRRRLALAALKKGMIQVNDHDGV